MTGPDESQMATRPISVAELLAKNGTLGAPPVTGRRRRRRGNADAVTVAELTGEIPIIRPDQDLAEPVEHPHTPPELSEQPVARRGRDGAPEHSHDPRPHRSADAVVVAQPTDVEVAESESPDRRQSVPGAEGMSPDPGDYGRPDELGLADVSYADTADSTLFGGDSLADELSRKSAVEPGEAGDGAVDLEVGDDDRDAGSGDAVYSDEYLAEYYGYDQTPRSRKILHGLLTAAQSVFAVVFGAGLFIAFDQLWKWNSLVAMVLAILVTLGLVAGVWVVRKTEDIASTLIAVGVGLLVTFGPLALMHAG
jgi:hypothetical protein